MIHVVAHITTKPGQRAAVLALFRANMPAVHAEDGCIEYQPVVDAAGFSGLASPLGDDGFMVIEKWSTDAALKAHAAAPHMASYGAKTKEMIAERAIYVLASDA